MVPEGESPLLLPANKHKQLVVIDFEYANANLPGLEFANHFVSLASMLLCFTDYIHYLLSLDHDTYLNFRLSGRTTTTTPSTRGVAILSTIRPWKSSIALSAHTSFIPLPTGLPVAQPPTHLHLILDHFRRPVVPPHLLQPLLQTPFQPLCSTHVLLLERSTPSRKPSASARQKKRPVASWLRPSYGVLPIRLCGIVQAHVPGLPDFEAEEKRANANENAAELESATTEIRAEAEAEAEKEKREGIVSQEKVEAKDGAKTEGDQDTDIYKSQDEEEFDYLAYAQDRAMFLWGDAIRMGMIKAEELPEDVRQRVRMVEY
jgi:choline kinase